jgi:hypothetical protein
MDTTGAIYFTGDAQWDKADLLFLRDVFARGMSIPDLAGFLNRSEDEVRQQVGSRGYDPILLRMRRSANATVAQRTTSPLSPPHRQPLGRSDEPRPLA